MTEGQQLTILLAVVLIEAVALVGLTVALVRRPSASQALEPLGRLVEGVYRDVTHLAAFVRARHELERQTAESVRHLEMVIAGTQSKGAAGENVLELYFANLPAEWQVRNLHIGNRVVEFALRLPNGLYLPIDSKWPATGLLDDLARTADPAERKALKDRVEQVVLARGSELSKYIDPSCTLSFAIAAVPDAVYDLCAGIVPALYSRKVILISYSVFIPYVLLVYNAVTESMRSIDLEKLETYLESVTASVAGLQEEVENRLSRALVMLANSRNGMRDELGQIHSKLVSIQAGAGVGGGVAGDTPGGGQVRGAIAREDDPVALPN